MDFQNTIFLASESAEDSVFLSSVFEKYGKKAFCILYSYEAREETLPSTKKNITFLKGIIVRTIEQAQNYHNLKKGKARAGEVAVVLYEPDLLSEFTSRNLRSICEKGWCDGVIDIHLSPKHDGLHKKHTYVTQVEALIFAQQRIPLLISKEQSGKVDSDRENRLYELKRLSNKFNFQMYPFNRF